MLPILLAPQPAVSASGGCVTATNSDDGGVLPDPNLFHATCPSSYMMLQYAENFQTYPLVQWNSKSFPHSSQLQIDGPHSAPQWTAYQKSYYDHTYDEGSGQQAPSGSDTVNVNRVSFAYMCCPASVPHSNRLYPHSHAIDTVDKTCTRDPC